MRQIETIQDVFDSMDNVETASNMAVAVGNEAVFVVLYTDTDSVVYIKVTPSEFKEMTKAVIEQVNIGLN